MSNVYYFPKIEIEKFVLELYEFIYGNSHASIAEMLNNYFKCFHDDLYCIAEYPYVEKFYRDNYYNFYSTKHSNYNRNTIRISFFDREVNDDTFRKEKIYKKIKEEKGFLGSITIRPTPPNIIGQSFLNKRILKSSNFKICEAKYKFLINGVRFETFGFPHNSQNLEATRCAEVATCNIMNYLSNKYQEYQSILPSELRKITNKTFEIRQLPSDGLRINDISYALKELGLDSLNYHIVNYPSELDNIIVTYIESGLPIIGVIDSNFEIKENNNHNHLHDQNSDQRNNSNSEELIEFNKQHTFIIIGKGEIKPVSQVNISPYNLTVNAKRDYEFFDSSDLIKEIVLSDDLNHPYFVKSLKSFDDVHDNNDLLEVITGIVVPLPQKVYVDATKAKDYSFNIVSKLCDLFPTLPTQKFVLRILLTSTRSFKEHINKKLNINSNVKDNLINFPTSRFIWLCEVYKYTRYPKSKCYGFITIDATQSNAYSEMTDTFLFGLIFDKVFYVDPVTKQLKDVSLQTKLTGYQLYTNL